MDFIHNPYGGFDCLISLDPEKAPQSQDDTSEREYVVCFFLADPISYNHHVNIETKDNLSFNVDSNDKKILVKFQVNENNLLEAVKFSLVHHSKNQAIVTCYDILSMLLSFWALNTLSGYIIRGLQLIDVKHQTRWQPLEFNPTPISPIIPPVFKINPDNEAVFSLYREGVNSSSIFYKFICFYKILEAWVKRRAIFKQTDNYIRVHKIELKRPKRTITQDMILVSSLSHNILNQYIHKSFGTFYEKINPYRVKVAHFISDNDEILNFDKYETLKDYYPITNLLDIIVRHILEDEIDLMNKINLFEKLKPEHNKTHCD